MVRVGTTIFGVLVALFGFFLNRIADAMNSSGFRDFTSTNISGISMRWIITGVGILIFIIGLVAPGPYYYPGVRPAYREERVVERQAPVGERVVETPSGERVVREESEAREVTRE